METNRAMRVLCLSFWTPPAIRPQAILIGKMLPEWIRQGVKPTLVTYDSCGKWDFEVPTVYIPEPPKHRILGRIPFIASLLENSYYERVYKIAEKAVNDSKPDVVFSFSNPQHSNVVGAMLHKRLGVKFIAHFSDPWYDNPYRSRYSLGEKRVQRLEKFVVTECERIVFIAPELEKSVLTKYPESTQKKGVFVPHCFNRELYPITQKKAGPFTISHLGIFRHDRTPEVLFQAVRTLITSGRVDAQAIKIRLFGGTSAYTSYSEQHLRALIAKYSLEPVVEVLPTVTFIESLRQMRESDCLAVIDANKPNCNFILSKVIDYAGSGKPIIGIMPSDNPTAKFLAAANQRAFSYTETVELAEYIEGLMRGQITPTMNQTFVNQFSVEETTKKLLTIFREVIRES